MKKYNETMRRTLVTISSSFIGCIIAGIGFFFFYKVEWYLLFDCNVSPNWVASALGICVFLWWTLLAVRIHIWLMDIIINKKLKEALEKEILDYMWHNVPLVTFNYARIGMQPKNFLSENNSNSFFIKTFNNQFVTLSVRDANNNELGELTVELFAFAEYFSPII